MPTCVIDRYDEEAEYEEAMDAFRVDPMARMFDQIGKDTDVLPDINTSIGSLTIEDIRDMESYYGDAYMCMYKSFTFSIFIPEGSSKKEIMHHIDICDDEIRALTTANNYEMITKPDIVM